MIADFNFLLIFFNHSFTSFHNDLTITTYYLILKASNISTTNIEIELIEDPLAPQDSKDFPEEEIITKMEETFKLNQEIFKNTEAPATKATKINTENSFIPRRVKKFDPIIKAGLAQLGQGPARIHDFGMTKFHLDSNNKTNTVKNQSETGKPAFSTTKFYNSKEFYSEILHKPIKVNSLHDPSQKLSKVVDAVREKLLKTNFVPIDKIEKNAASTGTTAPAAATIVKVPTHVRVLSRLEEKINSLDCDIQNLPADSTIWRGNETHELNLPIMVSIY